MRTLNVNKFRLFAPIRRPHLIRKLCGLLAVLLVAASITVVARTTGAPVEVLALFKDRAVVRTIDGQQMLRVGETSEFGVTLLQANPSKARVRYAEEVYTLTLSSRVGSNFSVPKTNNVRISKDTHGQYRIRGSIDGHFVNFLVDTGASVIAMSQRQADAIGLAYESGQRGSVQTAQGIAPAYFVQLSAVTIGSITRHGVQATVIEGSFPTEVLLGMSFLGKVRYADDNGVFVLSAKF